MNLARRRRALQTQGSGTGDAKPDKAREATDFALFVRTSDDGIVAWDRTGSSRP